VILDHVSRRRFVIGYFWRKFFAERVSRSVHARAKSLIHGQIEAATAQVEAGKPSRDEMLAAIDSLRAELLKALESVTAPSPPPPLSPPPTDPPSLEPITQLTMDFPGGSFVLHGDPDDAYFQGLAGWDLRHEPLARYLATLPRDAVCIDVGANIGVTAIMMAMFCPEGHVYAFEPGAENLRWLRRNIEANRLTNCTVVESAVGSTIGTVRFSEARAWGSITRDQDAGVAVPITTLDAFVESCPEIAKVDLIKIDVEGFEPHVLAGSAAIQQAHRPAIWMEFNSWALMTAGRTNPMTFASALWQTMNVKILNDDGIPVHAPEPRMFLHQHLLKRGSVEDILLGLSRHSTPPAITDMIDG
jgi:FkbM family methyltransferase